MRYQPRSMLITSYTFFRLQRNTRLPNISYFHQTYLSIQRFTTMTIAATLTTTVAILRINFTIQDAPFSLPSSSASASAPHSVIFFQKRTEHGNREIQHTENNQRKKTHFKPLLLDLLSISYHPICPIKRTFLPSFQLTTKHSSLTTKKIPSTPSTWDFYYLIRPIR